MISQELVRKKLQESNKWKESPEVISISDYSHGVDQEVKLIELVSTKNKNVEKEKIIMKVPLREQDKIMNEILGC